ncbi:MULTISPECIES: peptidoglycan editing factor PgeF [unclassified Bacteroides]|jgi:YfiH family protein|uniref:peptidoglycan editing factor PgeF n=1 Tax=unclassified Bacteroides TaxID=2646097 RepID=UPI000E9DBACD|nr:MULTISPECIES: peptidoglycan editing factor PgeF [unclassified Bacteroides]RGN48115.1 peptidoglycan editing factor PgeF [Bacteroides sp. OM05-12]RHR76222.1 peptidoglycan editing factor PgeF [Bacteroides sp. AF16-49]
MISVTEDNKMLGFELLKRSCPNISHFVTTRQGGYSKGAYESFNCSPYSGDESEFVCRNQEILLNSLPVIPKQLLIPYQTHSACVGIITNAFDELLETEKQKRLNGIDALITNVPGYCICVSTADCVPILLCDKVNQVIAVVHAGWRGTVQCILRKTLLFMQQIYHTDMQDVLACIGPSISLEAFEVGEEVWQSFHDVGFDMCQISMKNSETGKWHIDLWKANRIQLEGMGVSAHHIEIAGICTYTHHEQFFSARRLGVQSGRILSGIMLNDI